MFICFLWQDPLGEGMRLVNLKFLFCFCILEEEASNMSVDFQWRLPCPPAPSQPQSTPLRGRRQDMASWCLELTQVQRQWGGGEPRIITGFWTIRPLLTQALIAKTALYGELMVKLSNCQDHCSCEASPLRGEAFSRVLGLSWVAGAGCPSSRARTGWPSPAQWWAFPLGVSLVHFFSFLNRTLSPDLGLCSSVGWFFLDY